MQDYNFYLDKFGEYGEVTQISYPIVSIIGLPSARLNELVVFETGETGQIIALNHENANVLLFSEARLKNGTKLSRTDTHIQIGTGKELLGHIIDPFGNPLSKSATKPETDESRPIDKAPQGIANRAKINKHLITGTALIDIMIPIGKGQRQLVLGDRKTGKSSFVLNAVRNQMNEGAIAIYALIGKKTAEIKQLQAFMAKGNRKDNMIIVASNASDSPGLTYLTPFTAMTLAEYFRDQGRDVVLVLDDLLTHAKFYRELSLLAQAFPGRDSYPADIFYVHARLLERAGNFKHQAYDQVAITCLPIAETQEGDLTSYIVSNLMSITDGHIFFDANIFASGRRPAVNIPISVTRVGKQTQDTISKDINRELSGLFAVYERVESLSHFGSEMTESVKSIFSTGDKIYSFFNQSPSIIVPKDVALIIFALIWMHFLADEQAIETSRANLTKAYQDDEKTRLFIRSLFNIKTFNELLKNVSDYKETLLELCKPTGK